MSQDIEKPTPEQTPEPASKEKITEPPKPMIQLQLPESTPWVTYTLMVVSLGIYLMQFVSQAFTGVDILAAFGMKINEFILAGQVWRFITPIFLHGSLLHIGFNMYALYVLGPQMERHFGHWQFFLLYLVSGFAGVVASFVFTTAASLGASTAIFGLLGAHGVFAYKNQGVFGPQARRALRSIVNIAVINLLIGLTPGIDNWGHAGGLAGGLVIAWLGGPVYTLQGSLPVMEAVNQRSDRELVAGVVAAGIIFIIIAAATMIYRLN